MTAIELEAKRAHIIRMLFNTDNEEVLTAVEHFLSVDALPVDEKEIFYYSPEALRDAVLESEEDIRLGKVHTLEEMRSIHPRL